MEHKVVTLDRVVYFGELDTVKKRNKYLSGKHNQYDRVWFIGEPPDVVSARPYVYEGLIIGKWINPETSKCEYKIQTKCNRVFTIIGDRRLYLTKEEALDLMNH